MLMPSERGQFLPSMTIDFHSKKHHMKKNLLNQTLNMSTNYYIFSMYFFFFGISSFKTDLNKPNFIRRVFESEFHSNIYYRTLIY